MNAYAELEEFTNLEKTIRRSMECAPGADLFDWLDISSGLGKMKPKYQELMSRLPKRRQLKWRTQEIEYRKPILLALVEKGGRAHLSEVLEIVLKVMAPSLTKHDRDLCTSKTEPIWRNAARFERDRMVKAGLLAKPGWKEGEWEITDKGRAWLYEHLDSRG